MEKVTDPISNINAWLKEAKSLKTVNPDAMALATVDTNAQADVRYVLLKRVTDQGLEFFTNQKSTKAKQLLATKNASVALYWRELGRQVRAKGPIEQLAKSVVDEYFATRSRDSQIGAHASLQSSTLDSMETLAVKVKELNQEFAGKDVPTPIDWTGFIIKPISIEFWQEGAARLHERMRYFRDDEKSTWQTVRLYP